MNSETLKLGWTKVKFGEVVRLCKDRSSDPEADGIERYVGLEHLEPEDLRIRNWGLVADGTTFTSRFKPGQVLFGKRRAYQRKVAVADFEGVCSGDIYVFESADPKHLLPELLPFICQTDRFFEYAVGTSAGSLSPRTNWKSIRDYEFNLPPLETQREILTSLNKADLLLQEKFRLQKCAEKVIASLAQSVFQDMMNSLSEQLQELGEVCIKGPQSGIYKPKENYGVGIPMIHMGELFANDCINCAEGMQLVELDPNEAEKYRLTNNDLLFGRRSLVLEGAGRCVLIKNLVEEVTFESSILRVTCDIRKLSNEYAFEWFRSPQGMRFIQSIITFTTVAGVKGSDVAKLKLPIPDLNTQTAISQRISQFRTGVKAANNDYQRTLKLSSLLREKLLIP